MTFRSHITLGIIGGFTLTYMPNFVPYKESDIIAVLPLIALGSIFPDIDEPNSYIGKRMPGFSHIVSMLFGHRGFTHFLAFPAILCFLGVYFFPNLVFFIYAFCFGILMHQIGDMVTKSGIPKYFFPLAYGPFKNLKAVLLPQPFRFRTGGKVEMLFVLPTLLALLGLIIWDKYGEWIFAQVWRFING